jgi:hypothetical protein
MFVRVETAAGSYLLGGIAEKIADRLSQLIASVRAAVFSSWALDEAVEQAAETPRNEAEKRRIAVLTVRGIRLSVSAQIAFSCFEFRIARVCGLGHCG